MENMLKIRKPLWVVLIIVSMLASVIVRSQFDPARYYAFSRLDYYTSESFGEVIVNIPASLEAKDIRIDLAFEHSFLSRQVAVQAGGLNSVPVSLEKFKEGDNEVTVSFYEDLKWVDSRKVNVKVLEWKYNEVKIDRVHGGLVSYGLPFLPFGFYTYWPVHPALLEEEAVKGFNMVSPYWKVDKKSRKERMEFMDRCAELGMMVNFNVCSVAGGGGVASSRDSERPAEEKMDLLREEIGYFRDHPALLSWYIADEPYGQGVSPDYLEEIYRVIKETDPYHPVSIVFMEPGKAFEYSAATDIVMADPYPVPGGKVSEVSDVADNLMKQFRHDKPLWMVPQAFGGNEWWKREPTGKELGAMTWLAVAEGASGIQYFIRDGLNGFPKSTATWSEAGKISLMAGDLGPALLLGIPEVVVADRDEIKVRAVSFRGELIILAANSSPEPSLVKLQSRYLEQGTTAEVEYENRKVNITLNGLEDMIDGYGIRIYRMMMRENISHPEFRNMLVDPGFENNISPGIPSACYARAGEDRGATYFTDPRVVLNGNSSLRLNTPAEGEGNRLSFYNVILEPGKTYTLSISAITGSSVNNFEKKKKFLGPHYWVLPEDPLEFEWGAGNLAKHTFYAGRSWERHDLGIDLYDEVTAVMVSPELELISKGTAWFDEMRLVPDIWLNTTIDDGTHHLMVELYTPINDAELRYSFFDFEGNGSFAESREYDGNPLEIKGEGILEVIAMDGDRIVGKRKDQLFSHLGLGRNVNYNTMFSHKYPAGKEKALLDGRVGSRRYSNPFWQGFEGVDAEVVVDLGQVQTIREVQSNFLNNPDVWIFLPRQVTVTVSEDGWKWEEFGIQPIPPADRAEGPEIFTATLNEEPTDARYIKVLIENIGTCPQGHAGEGEKAWLFVDEIIIN